MGASDLQATIKSQLQAFSVGSYIHQSMVAQQFGLHPTDMLAIHYLEQHGEMTAGHLGALLGLTSGATTAAVDRLIKLGFAGRTSHTEDRRRVYIHLQPANLQKLKAVYRMIDKKLAHTLGTYSDNELRVISNFLGALSDN